MALTYALADAQPTMKLTLSPHGCAQAFDALQKSEL